MATSSVTAVADYEFEADEFWREFRIRTGDMFDFDELACNCRIMILDGEVELTDANAIAEFDAFVNAIPGFRGGPECAKTAIIFRQN